MSPADPEYMKYISHFSGTQVSISHIQNFASNVWNMYDNSNVRVVSGDYLKLTSLSLRYVVPKRICQKMYMKSAYLSVSGTNLFTICSKKLKGQDPSQFGSSELINISVRPTYSLSLNVTF